MNILMVCTGNLCRSPMAEGIMRAALQAAGVEGVEVTSSGTWAGSGHHATIEACTVLEGRGIDLTTHRSRPLVAASVEQADLVVAMTSVHLRELEELAPGSRAKTLLMKELSEVRPKLVAGATRAERLAALLKARRPQYRRALDLDDPIGLPLYAYERCANEIERGVESLIAVLR